MKLFEKLTIVIGCAGVILLFVGMSVSVLTPEHGMNLFIDIGLPCVFVGLIAMILIMSINMFKDI